MCMSDTARDNQFLDTGVTSPSNPAMFLSKFSKGFSNGGGLNGLQQPPMSGARSSPQVMNDSATQSQPNPLLAAILARMQSGR